MAEVRGGEPAAKRSDVRIRRSLPGEVVVDVEGGRKKEGVGMRPVERVWVWV